MAGILAERRQRLLALKKLRGGAATERRRTAATTCPSCGRDLPEEELAANQRVCPYCGHHFPLPARERLHIILDEGSFKELDPNLVSRDPLDFPGYPEKLKGLNAKTHLGDAVVTGLGKIGGVRVAVAALDTGFLMASMGAVVGEKLARLIERAGKSHLPLIIFSASGGARMQEGIVSLMQMAKTSAAIQRFSDKGGLYISVLTHPTTGGVTASFASLGDIMLAEPGALIGFAGPRVIEQTIGEKLPEGFQSAEFQLEHGFLDAVVPRARMRSMLIRVLALHGKGGVNRDRTHDR
ncbi:MULTISPECIES: acetyl-CoA carboxylase, carboxyltransferase subunit beta [Collinsella]|uniref:acetyl-CoA carboxylase, carboxyltransferase subunit beta n=1 Tax=Collinsella TaxID=102106 RepID=UPI000B36B3D2|nr:acetyl-CoA carboxylase, carboxyltransferase subunit beta [Collinsella intestinalis]MBM6907986.1 acetyl-CoA carboxylase carboxyltransferase subunit beta [Collinsella intestinalis]MDM8162888.1 acetyl-CoA carboxylase, carboxyltransferase subunit beta [Collinsella intestinalis]OUO64725.1 acetyl-CoA carboxylase, carboxyltransferase subunit beta [Collinsella sp. An268]